MAIKEVGKNKYKLDIPIGYNGGKRIRHTETINCTKKEAILIENQIKLEIKNNTFINKRKETVSMFIEEWLKSRKGSVAIKTYKNYELYCKNICKYLGHIKLINLNGKILDSFYNELRTKTNYSDRTIKDHYTAMTTILNTAINWNYLNVNPNLKAKPIKYKKREIPCYSPAEVTKLVQVLENEPLKNKLLISLALDTGCRRGELTGLTWEDIDFKSSSVRINKVTQYVSGYGIFEKSTKTDSSNRIVYISESILNLLKEYRKEQLQKKLKLGNKWENSKRIFTTEYGADMHPNTPSKIFDKIIKKYNLKKISFHGLRHTNASLLHSKQVPLKIISTRLGHSNIEVTNSIYTHLFEDELKKVAKITESFFENKSDQK